MTGDAEASTGSRDRLIDATSRLLKRQGYAATGLKQIVAESGAPRGSLYFYFPGGKEELAVAALEHACEARAAAIRRVLEETTSATEAICGLTRAMREELVASEFADGCPLATVALEMASTSDAIQGACAKAWKNWAGLIRERLEAEGHDAVRARDLATMSLALLEGSLLLARAYRSPAPLDQAIAELPAILQRR